MTRDIDLTCEVRAAIARHRISTQTVATAIGKTQQTASRKLSGQIPMTLAELHAIAELAGEPASSLIARDAA